MKRISFLLVCALCVGGGLAFYTFSTRNADTEATAFLPENVLLYFNHKELGKIYTDFKKTPLAEVIDSIDFIKIALDIEIPIMTVDKMRRIRESVEDHTTRLLLNELLSEDFTIALLPGDADNNPYQFLFDNSLLISRPRHNVSLLQLASSVFAERFSLFRSQYGKHIIHRLKDSNDFTISFVMVDKLVLIALNERILRQGLDRYDEKKENLSDNFFFNALQNKYTDPHLFGFFSIDLLQRYLQKMLETAGPSRAGSEIQLNNWDGFTSGGYGIWHRDTLIKSDATLFFNKNELNEHTLALVNIRPQKDKKIGQVPADVLLYYWTNTFNLPVLWDLYKKEILKDGGNPEETAAYIQKFAGGTSIDTLLSLVGNTFSIIVKEPATVDLVPLPNFTLVFGLRDINTTRSLLRDTLRRNEVPHNSKYYRGIKFIYWGEEEQGGLQPVYALYKDSFYLASSIATLKDVVDSIKKKNGLTKSEDFITIGDPMLQNNNSFGYFRFAPILEASKELVSWGGTMLAIQNRSAAFKSKIVIDNFIQPLLEGLKMYPTVTTRSYVDEGAIIFESTQTIAP